ncbi:helicase-related protein [Priestia sp. YIM B13551]
MVGIDKAKMGPEPYYAGTWRRKNGAKDEYCWHCPDCGQPLKKKVDSTWIDLTWSSVAEGKAPEIDVLHEAMANKELLPNGLPKGYKVKWKSVRKHMKCCYRDDVNGYLPEGSKPCGTKMYRSAVKSRGETRNNPRVNISRILKRFNGLFDLYICDEVHKSKGAGSGRGDAFAAMVKAAKRNLLLTGTLVNGKSSSIKELLWRTDAKSLLEHGFSHQTGDVDWAKKYGKLEQVIKIAEEEKQGIVTRQSRRASQPVESPGIAPHMTAEFLLHKAGFLELGDMGLPLVELKEIPVFVSMDQEHASEYNHFHQKLYQKCAQLSAIGVKGAWSKFTPATIMYADRPDLGAFVKFDDETIAAPRIEGFHAKELKMVELVKKELAEDRGCVIYNNYTGQYRMNQRTKEVLAAHGIEAVILDEPNTDKRAEVIQKLEDEGRKVVITNMKLVEVGLDLLYWPTIINNQMSYEVSVFRQSNRRNWRIGQEKECRCYILVYDGSQQMSQFLSVMSGRGHAMLTEGRLDRSELAEFSRDGQSSLASDLAACFADSNVADAWTKLAAKDLESIETVAEADFKKVIEARMKALANETRRLCGVPVVGEHEPVEATAFPSSSHAQVSEVSIWGNLTGWENEDLFGTLTGWETSGNPFETEQLDMFVFEEALPVEFPPIKQEENTRTLFLVGA